MEVQQGVFDNFNIVIMVTRDLLNNRPDTFRIEIEYKPEAREDYLKIEENMMDIVVAKKVDEFWKKEKLPEDGAFVLIGNSYEDIVTMSKRFKVNTRSPNYEI
jgi:hypothetical protein